MKKFKRFGMYLRMLTVFVLLLNIYQTERLALFLFCVVVAVAIESNSILFELQTKINKIQGDVNQEIRSVLQNSRLL